MIHNKLSSKKLQLGARGVSHAIMMLNNVISLEDSPFTTKIKSPNKPKEIFQDPTATTPTKIKTLVTRAKIDITWIALRHQIRRKITSEYSKRSIKVTKKFKSLKGNIIDE